MPEELSILLLTQLFASDLFQSHLPEEFYKESEMETYWRKLIVLVKKEDSLWTKNYVLTLLIE